jgi:large subunit ribosomal protein L2
MIKIYKPTTQARRKMSVTDYSVLSRRHPEKSLSFRIKKRAGRDDSGKISVRHQGGGSIKKYRVISSLDKRLGQKAVVREIEYDPNRTAFIALVEFEDKSKMYILAWEGIKLKSEIVSGDKVEIKPGNRLKLANIPNGLGIFDIELKPGQGGILARSAGSSASIMAKENQWVQIKLPSNEVRRVNKNCLASIGQVSNITHSSVRIGKAGRQRHKGIRPTVRGKVMSPAAHPHGGGEGVNPIGLKYPKTPWGKHARGTRTRKKNKYSQKMIIKRRRK